MRNNIPFTDNETAFLKMLIVAFNGVAETFNMEMELRWTARQVGTVASSLKRKGIITTHRGGGTMEGGAGSTFILTKENEKIIQSFDIKYNGSNEYNYKNTDLAKLISNKI